MNPIKPLSPHLQIYRPQLTSVLSITHRVTGIALSIGTCVLLYWLLSVAAGPDQYANAQQVLSCWLVRMALVGWTWAFFYHLCNGIRHLFWDAGYGFALSTAYKSGYAVLAASVILTGLIWACIVSQQGSPL